LRAQHRNDAPVDLDGRYLSSGFGQRQGQRAESGPDLHDPGSRSDTGQMGDLPNRVAVGHEVLTEGPTRMEIIGVEQSVYVCSAMGH
jgi:hypothetical protein